MDELKTGSINAHQPTPGARLGYNRMSFAGRGCALRSDSTMSAEEHARRVVGAYANGIICSGEVFNQFIDHISPKTVDVYMSSLSSELIRRFRTNIEAQFKVDYPLASAEDIDRWQDANALIADWLHRRSPEDGPANGSQPFRSE